MKYLLVVTVVLVAFWIWRNNRQADRAAPPKAAKRRGIGRPAPMVACDQSGMHLPADEAVPGRNGVYCCAEHRRQAEGTAG
jgi:uncharacterized protein